MPVVILFLLPPLYIFFDSEFLTWADSHVWDTGIQSFSVYDLQTEEFFGTDHSEKDFEADDAMQELDEFSCLSHQEENDRNDMPEINISPSQLVFIEDYIHSDSFPEEAKDQGDDVASKVCSGALI